MELPEHISQIALIIRQDWSKVNYAAEPYLKAMSVLDHADDQYFEDAARSVIRYFLANASTWRGPVAKAVKAKLKTIIGDG